ncbi:MAG: hypothetical protein NTY32_02795 [Bacteroidia bacterium]|nr:hypothetical protein [Bacteroidia bacterium]
MKNKQTNDEIVKLTDEEMHAISGGNAPQRVVVVIDGVTYIFWI